MEWLDNWGLSIATFLPLLGAAAILFIPSAQERLIKRAGVGITGVALLVGILTAFRFDYGISETLQLDVNREWIPQIGSNYHVGIDGISLPMFVLSLLVSFLCLIYCCYHVPDPGKPKALIALILLLETGMT